MIVAYHLFPGFLPGGFIAVEVFFCISGFLITSKLIHEANEAGEIHYWRFIKSRLNRLYPTLLFCVLVSLTLGVLVHADVLTGARLNALSALTFTTNLVQLFSGGSYENSYLPNIFEHTWFLGLIFQFYLVLPLLLKVFLALMKKRRDAIRYFGLTMLILGIVSAALMIVYGGLFGMPDRAYFSLDSHMAAFCFGAAFAVFNFFFPRAPRTKKHLPTTIFAASAAAIIVMAIFLRYSNPLSFMIGLPATGLLTVVIIACVIRQQRNIRERRKTYTIVRIFEGLGNLSYGIYLLHWPLYILLPHLLTPDTASYGYALTNIALCLLLSSFVFEFFRTDNLRRKITKMTTVSRVSYGMLVLVLVAASVVSLVRAPRVSSISEQLSQAAGQESEEIISTATYTGDYLRADLILDRSLTTLQEQLKLAKKDKPAVKPNTSIAAKNANEADVLVLGDSVTLGAKAAIESTIVKSFVDAKESRGIETATGLLANYAARGPLPRTIVISLATNERPINDKTIEDIVKVAGKNKTYILVTAYAGPLQPRETQNAALKHYADKHANVYVADWWSIAHNNWSLMYADHIHLNPEGRQAYANMLSNVLKGVRR